MIEVLYKNAVSNDADIARCGRCTYFENIKLDSYNSSYYNEDKKIIKPNEFSGLSVLVCTNNRGITLFPIGLINC